LREKDIVFLNGSFEKIKIIKDLNGKKINSAYPSSVVKVEGLNSSAELGDRFLVVENSEEREEIERNLEIYKKEKRKKNVATINSDSKEKTSKNLILLANSENSLKALEELVEKTNKKSSDLFLRAIFSESRNLKDETLELAKLTESIVVSFGKIGKKTIKNLEEREIPYFHDEIIYKIEERLEEIISKNVISRKVEKIIGEALIVKKFDFSKGSIAGCKVTNGIFKRSDTFRVINQKNEKIFEGKIKSLEVQKKSENEVRANQECGVVFEKGFDKFGEGDKIISFRMEEDDK
jgi:translation initiation factor IF-2